MKTPKKRYAARDAMVCKPIEGETRKVKYAFTAKAA